MIEFSQYYVEYVETLFKNIWKFIVTFFGAFWNIFAEDIPGYFKTMIERSVNFNPFEWIALVLTFILNVALFTFIILRLIQLCRRHIIFRKREIEKQELIDEINTLNSKVLALIDEKNRILAVKVSSITGQLSTDELNATNAALEGTEEKPAEVTKEAGNSRFVKLIDVDNEYSDKITSIIMKESDMLSLAQLVDRFVNYSANQMHLYYDRNVIATYFSGMATSKIMILEGISGTGKTSLPYAMGHFFKNNAGIVSVQPSWRDRAELLGYLNEFTKRFNETDFLKFLYECTYREDVNFIVLDEMNLARIEYYFAEFLSIMEMPDKSEWLVDLVPDSWPNDPKYVINGKILVPQNVWFIGTANKDDSTFTITDKVYDRAVTVELNSKANYFDAPYTEAVDMSYEYLDSLYQKAGEEHAISPKNLQAFDKLDSFIQAKFKIAFGNRIVKQIKLFVPVYVACGCDELEGLDFMLRSKILRKFESLNLAFLHDELDELISLLDKLFGKNTFKISIAYLKDLQKMS